MNREQELSNYLHKKDFKNAIRLSLELNQPRRLLRILSDVIENENQGHSPSLPPSLLVWVSD